MKSDNLYAPREVEHDPPASFTKTLISICEYTICKQTQIMAIKMLSSLPTVRSFLMFIISQAAPRDNKKHEKLNALMSVFTFQH